ncbi:MAG: PASTA domain-containing protein, partial [Actinomycetota bacterium]
QVPSVIGLDQATATLVLEEAGFFVEARLEESTQPPGTVIYQGPAAGIQATQTGVVTITVSSGDASTPAADAPG